MGLAVMRWWGLVVGRGVARGARRLWLWRSLM